MSVLRESPRQRRDGATSAPWPRPRRGRAHRPGTSREARLSYGSQQTPALLFESLIDEAQHALGHVIEIVPTMPAGARGHVELVRHAQGAQLLMQSIAASIPGVGRVDAIKNM